MPHRVHFLSTAIGQTYEGLLLAALAIANGLSYTMAVISDSDWDRITGPHGFLFGAVIAIGILWNAGRVREKNETKRRDKEEEAREVRHAQLVATNRENAESLKALTVEAIKAQGKATHAIETMDRNIQHLTNQLADRPCQLKPTR